MTWTISDRDIGTRQAKVKAAKPGHKIRGRYKDSNETIFDADRRTCNCGLRSDFGNTDQAR
jgi:hypothetical protein